MDPERSSMPGIRSTRFSKKNYNRTLTRPNRQSSKYCKRDIKTYGVQQSASKNNADKKIKEKIVPGAEKIHLGSLVEWFTTENKMAEFSLKRPGSCSLKL